MNPAFLLLAALLLPISSAVAGSWHTLHSNSQMLLEADDPQPESSRGNGKDKAGEKEKKLQVWGKSTYSRPEQARPGDFFYTSAKSLLAINCTKRTYKLLQKIYYAADNQEIKHVHYGETEKPENIVPDSTEDRVFDFACTFKPPKADNQMTKRAQPKTAAPEEKPITDKQVSQAGKEPQKADTKPASNGKASAKDKSTTAKPKDSEAAKPKR